MADENRLKELLGEALPYVEMHDLVGTGGAPRQEDIDDINKLMDDIIEILELDPDNYGRHSDCG